MISQTKHKRTFTANLAYIINYRSISFIKISQGHHVCIDKSIRYTHFSHTLPLECLQKESRQSFCTHNLKCIEHAYVSQPNFMYLILAIIE